MHPIDRKLFPTNPRLCRPQCCQDRVQALSRPVPKAHCGLKGVCSEAITVVCVQPLCLAEHSLKFCGRRRYREYVESKLAKTREVAGVLGYKRGGGHVTRYNCTASCDWSAGSP